MYKLLTLLILALSSQVHAEFVDNGNGTVTDNIRSLIWEQVATAQTGTMLASDGSDISANEYCSNLTLAGFNNWRLPRIDELLTLADYTDTNGRAINSMFQGDVGVTWSSTIYADDKNILRPNETRFWTVDFEIGNSQGTKNDTPSLFRCVYGSSRADLKTSEKMVIIDNGIIKDPGHNLYWQRRPKKETQAITMPRAQLACEQLELGGYEDWYLPSITELQTIIDYTEFNPALDSSIISDLGLINKAYWSSTTSVDWIEIWTVDLKSGSSVLRADDVYRDDPVIGAICVRKGDVSDDPQPNIISLEPNLSFTAPIVRVISEDGGTQDYIINFEYFPSEDGNILFDVKHVQTIQ